MVAIEIRQATPRRVVLRFPRLFGWLFTLGALGGTAVLWRIGEADARPAMLGIGGACALVGLLTLLRRYQVDFDLAAGTYRGLRGFWPSVRPFEGRVDELESVVLIRKRRSGSGSGSQWIVALDFGDDHATWPSPLRVYMSSSRNAAKKRDELAALFGVPTRFVDKTGLGPLLPD